MGERTEFTDDLKRLLASPNICSKRWVYEQYDSMVQTNTVEGPGAEGGVIRVKETNRGLAMALDGNSRWCYLDPKLGAMHAVAESARNVACTGATPIAATNCLNFGNPEKPHIMWQFSQTIDGITKACEELETPITGGNVSFYNETLGEGIYPTPVMGVVGIIEDVHKAVGPHFREAGKSLVLLRGSEPGDASDVEAEFGSSEYAKEILGQVWGFPPSLELDQEAALQKAIVEMIDSGLVESAKDCSEGGVAVTLAECGFARGVGAEVDLSSNDLVAEFVAVWRGCQPNPDFLRPTKRGGNQTNSGKIRPLRGSHRRDGSGQVGDSSDGRSRCCCKCLRITGRVGKRAGEGAARRDRRAIGSGDAAEELATDLKGRTFRCVVAMAKLAVSRLQPAAGLQMLGQVARTQASRPATFFDQVSHGYYIR